MAAANSGGSIRHVVCDAVTAPLPLFTHATVHAGVVYVSCVQGFLPGTFDFPSPDPGDQARQVLENLRVILEHAGSSLALVLKLTIFMTDMQDFERINEAVNACFPVAPPARSSLAVAALPRNARVVIEAIAAERAD
jgi:2-iminobutanoate/2-iminopropanoate deaminase